MPVPLDIRARFIETHLVDEFGRPLKVHPWMRQHVLAPLDGYQSWRAGERLCDECRAKVARIHTTLEACRVLSHGGCDGVDGHKIVVALLNLKRQQGKTTTGAAYSLSELFLARNSNVLYLAAAEKQSERIFEAKWVAPIDRNPKLRKKVVINGDEIRNERKGNYLRFIATSAKSVPGGTWRLLLIDEGALVNERVVAKLVPSVISAHGQECPHGHYTTGAEDEARRDCPTCGTALEEWFGRVLVMSSSDEDSGWFFELVDLLTNDPTPSAYLYRSTETLNAHTSEATIAALENTFGRLPSMETYMRRELHNEFTREGDEFLPAAAIKAIVREDLQDVDASDLKCVGFLDCSRTSDLTSLVLTGDPDGSTFERLRVLRIDVFDPKISPYGRVDYAQIRALLEEVAGTARFPNLLKLWIDTSLLQDAQELYDWARRQPWGGKIHAHRADEASNLVMWGNLAQRCLSRPPKIEIPPHRRLVEELKAARVRSTPKGYDRVVDSSAGDRRGRIHRDVAMSLAGCCLAASEFVARARTEAGGASLALRINESLAVRARFKSLTGDVKKRSW